MKWIKNLKIGSRMGIGFGAILIMMVGTVMIGIINMKKMEGHLEHIVNISELTERNAVQALIAVTNIGSSVKTIAMLDDRKAQEDEILKIEDARTRYKDAMAKVEELDKSDKGKELIARAKDSIASAKGANNKVMDLANAGKKNEALSVIINESQPLTKKVDQAFEELFKYEQERTTMGYEEAKQANNRATLYLVIIGVIALTTGITMAFFLTRNIVTRLGRVTKAMGVVADGDLTTKIRIYANDEIGELGNSINRMLDTLNDMVLSIRSTADQVASAAEQLHATSDQMATGAEEVAAQSGAVATAGEEMAATATDIARNSNHAADRAKQANDLAITGSAVVKETIQGIQIIARRVKETAGTVEQLGERSDQIGDIVGTIEDIADQTNLLALNAAIEAARAGDQGRGFAVVADEVRALAVRTTNATKEISGMIKSIQCETKNAVGAMNQGVSEAERGATEAVKSDHALTEILRQIGEVSMQVSQIATAAEQQTAVTGEISNNIQQISSVIEESAKGTHESAQAARQLAHLAEALHTQVDNFKLAV